VKHEHIMTSKVLALMMWH